MLIVVIGVFALYLFRILLFMMGARRAARPPAAPSSGIPRISVIVAARNEEGNIERCLASLARLDYPPDKIEVIVVNDGSTDATREIAERFTTGTIPIRVIDTADEPTALRGKARAIAQGVDASSGEIFVTTDADCAVPPAWLRAIAEEFGPRTGVVTNFTLITSTRSFAGMQSLDWAHLQTYASGGVGLGIPISCIGNNLAFRREAYLDVGGYRGIPFSVTEDLELFRAVALSGRWETRAPCRADALVWSLECPNVATLWRQKQRWLQGGLRIGARGYALILPTTAINVLIFAALISGHWPIALAALAARFVADSLIVAATLARLGQIPLLRFAPVFELFTIAHECLVPAMLVQRRVKWKGREF